MQLVARHFHADTRVIESARDVKALLTAKMVELQSTAIVSRFVVEASTPAITNVLKLVMQTKIASHVSQCARCAVPTPDAIGSAMSHALRARLKLVPRAALTTDAPYHAQRLATGCLAASDARRHWNVDINALRYVVKHAQLENTAKPAERTTPRVNVSTCSNLRHLLT